MGGINYSAIRAAVPLQTVLDLLEFVPVYRRGDQVRGPCPIHGSNSPQGRSLSANLARNAFRCFTCGAAGNQLDLWSLTQSMSLFAATTELCNRLQIHIPQTERQREQTSTRRHAEKRNP
jgi:DNA primase